ncbi:MAG: hypothetical protein JAY90_07215 [Candidatus Thiodiazotropha lotti]|nr:hypothetical protein [Candidatus Thiodiazotropha lotti]
MNPIRIISMSAPNSVNFRNVGKSTPEMNVNSSIAAAMCSGMPALWWSAARLKWADDRTGISLLNEELLKFAEQTKQNDKWTIRKERDYLRKIVALAILEMSYPNKYCKDKLRCEFLGMSPSAYSVRWKKRYEIIYRQLDDWCSHAIGYLYKQNYL